jgi:hypothetical protein
MPSTKPAGNGGLTRFALGPWDRSDQACRNAGASYQYHRRAADAPISVVLLCWHGAGAPLTPVVGPHYERAVVVGLTAVSGPDNYGRTFK